jgi:hypothetical protein
VLNILKYQVKHCFPGPKNRWMHWRCVNDVWFVMCKEVALIMRKLMCFSFCRCLDPLRFIRFDEFWYFGSWCGAKGCPGRVNALLVRLIRIFNSAIQFFNVCDAFFAGFWQFAVFAVCYRLWQFFAVLLVCCSLFAVFELFVVPSLLFLSWQFRISEVLQQSLA